MNRLLLAILFLLLGSACWGQSKPMQTDARGAYLGLLFAPIPESVLENLPRAPREGGVLITHVLPDSPAAVARLRKNDILLQYDGQAIKDAEHLARLINASKPGQVVKLSMLRGGRDMTLPVQLGLGPAMQIVKSPSASLSRGVAKPNGPSPLSVTATPLEGNKVKVTFEFYESGKFRQITCSGEPEILDRQVETLPEKIKDQARSALKRLRDLDLTPPPSRSQP